MKKLYRKGSVHPSPPPVADPLAFLPLAILTLAAALSPEDREVLAYLISCGNVSSSKTRTKSTAARPTTGGGRDHPPSFDCSCFRCYTSYWARWDSSPNRQRIHEIIDALEDDLVQTQVGNGKGKGKGEKKERRRKGPKTGVVVQRKVETGKSEFSTEPTESGGGEQASGDCDGEVLHGEEREDAVCCEKGSVRRFVSFIGERLWNVWT